MTAISRKNIAILGSTGSIGTQTLEVIRAFPDHYKAVVLSAQSNFKLLIEQALEFKPSWVVIAHDCHYSVLSEALNPHGIQVMAGQKALTEIVTLPDIDVVLMALVGFAGLEPSLLALESGKTLALANKETLVVAGSLVTSLAISKGLSILPVDSEHSAIFQCLSGENARSVEKIILTASGGPFRAKSTDFLAKATANEALKHPNWTMGNKITIDSASMMNKGLEVIEAKWLFDLKPEQIEVIVHPQSVVHSMVQFTDGSVKAQLGVPDMRLPIVFALSYPERLVTDFPRLSFTDYPNLTFEPPDLKKFRNLALAFEALEAGGNASCVLNAANEIVVAGFLKGKIGFLEMSEVIEKCLSVVSFISAPCLKDLIETDQITRQLAHSLLK
ncbi:MAG: 1-deoxy-D-xylulose-5-phosphate reductoisomerase [Bacteroidota bacterium]